MSTGTSEPAEEQLLTALQTATDRLIHYATRGTGTFNTLFEGHEPMAGPIRSNSLAS